MRASEPLAVTITFSRTVFGSRPAYRVAIRSRSAESPALGP